ncbi:type II secretion system F family protein [Verrucomicrobia bacterium]|jgi:type II secretory pathway component PulF|nr:type II secretion system F family protein [bacterium]MDA7866783.1 type II secretion system F family protein [Verrucomicrobiota bacterium]
MAQFSYKARRRSGELVKGVLDGNDRGAALIQIERLGLLPVSLDMVKGGKPSKGGAVKGSKEDKSVSMPPFLRELMERKRKPKLQELATYTQQLANLLRSGMPLTVALNSMGHLESKGIAPEVSKQLRQDVMEGKSLSDSMGKQSHIFSDLYVNMVRAGEQSGALEEVLRRLATHFERFAEVQQKFVSALIYPGIVGGVGVSIIVLFMTVILPKFTSIFTDMNVPLPKSTQILISVSGLFSSYWWLLPLVGILLVVFYRRFSATEGGRRSLDRWKISLPVIGKVMKLNLFGQFARTLSTLLHNGVPVLTALKITEKIMPNVILRDAISQTREGVTDGKTIAQPLARSQVFPQLMIDLIKIGEETGDVPGALQSVAETYENELTIGLRVMTNLIEPAMIIMMAIGVGGLLFSILSAMFQITSSIGRG